MRSLGHRAERLVERAGVALASTVRMTWHRDRFGPAPASQDLYAADRTRYVRDVDVIDLVDRPDSADLGSNWGAYTGAGFSGLKVDGQAFAPAAISGVDDRLEVEATLHPADQHGSGVLEDWDPAAAYIAAGIILRGSPPGTLNPDYYGIAINANVGGALAASIYRFNAGVPTWNLADEVAPTRWYPGDELAASAEYNVLRLYHNGVIILEFTDTSGAALLGAGHVGVGLWKDASGDAVRVRGFRAGPLRREYLPLVLEVGTLQDALGIDEPSVTPATVELALINTLPVAGQPSLAALARHGLNRGAGTFDPVLADVRLYSLLDHARLAGAPIQEAALLLEEITAVDAEQFRCRAVGREASLDLFLEAGVTALVPPILSTNSNWFAYSNARVERACDGAVTPSAGLSNDGTFTGPWPGDALVDKTLCVGAFPYIYFIRDRIVLFRDPALVAGATLEITYTGVFAEKKLANSGMPGTWHPASFSFQVVIFEPPADLAALAAYRTGYFGEAPGPTVKTVLQSHNVTHGDSLGTIAYAVGGAQLVGLLIGHPADPAGAYEKAYTEVSASLAIT